jgi:hypothetical protein
VIEHADKKARHRFVPVDRGAAAKIGPRLVSTTAYKPLLQVEGAPDFSSRLEELQRLANATDTLDSRATLDAALQLAWLNYQEELDKKKHPSSKLLKQLSKNIRKTESLLRRLEKFPRLGKIAFDLCPVGEGTIGVKTAREMILGETVSPGQPLPLTTRRVDIVDPEGSIAAINIHRVLERLQRETARHSRSPGRARAEGKLAIVAYAADFFRRYSVLKLTSYSGGAFAKFCSRFFEVVTGESDAGGTALEAQIKLEVKTPSLGN